MRYRREVDGLRALAVLPVTLWHAGFNQFSGGFVGVDVFFVISGYLITSIIFDKKRKGDFTFADFYERRARRILPALLAMLLVSAPLAWATLLPQDMVFFTHSAVTVLGFFSNVFFSHTTGYFGVTSPLNPLIHTWSLAVEEQYYLVFPILISVLGPLGQRTTRAILFVLLIASLCAAQYFVTANPQFAFYLLPTRGWEILAGALIALRSSEPRSTSTNLEQWGSLLGLALIVYSIFAFNDGTPSPGLYMLLPVIGACLVIACTTEATLVGKLLGIEMLVVIGRISYSLYLVHQPLLAFARHELMAEPDLATTLLLLLISFALAYTSWRFIEQPCRNHSIVPRPRLAAYLGTGTACVLAISITGLATKGLPGRFDQEEAANQAMLAMTNAERGRLVRGAVCHFNDLEHGDLGKFLKQWDCRADPAFPQAKRIPVIITGDSHSADKVISLKLNGLLALQIGGAGCSIVPSRMTGDCQRIFRRLHEVVANNASYQYLALAHAFTESELTPREIAATLSYWKTFNKHLVWFGSMPTFYQFSAHIERNRPPVMNPTIPMMSQGGQIKRMMEDAGIHIINTEQIYCSINHCSPLSKEGCLLLTDDTHLTLWGARLFGEALLKIDPFFAQWAPEAGPSPPLDTNSCHKPVGAIATMTAAG